ncbi:MAG: hypothetical protein ACLUB2_00035 [Butyricicoccus pullicaecorum]
MILRVCPHRPMPCCQAAGCPCPGWTTRCWRVCPNARWDTRWMPTVLRTRPRRTPWSKTAPCACCVHSSACYLRSSPLAR